jgi:hypothetical protein
MTDNLKKFCDGGINYFGNGTIYISDAKDIERFDETNFDIVRLDRSEGPECEVNAGVIICLGQESASDAIAAVELVLTQMKLDIVRGKIIPQPPRKDAQHENELLVTPKRTSRRRFKDPKLN